VSVESARSGIQAGLEPSPGRAARIETWTCRFELETPIFLEHAVIRTREYTIVRVTAEDGTCGLAYGLTRGAPIGETIDRLVAPLVLDHDADDVYEAARRVKASLMLIGLDNFPLRALSLVDICLWDIKAKCADMPVWRLLGGVPATVPTLLVDSYAEKGTTVDATVENLVRRQAEGYAAFKLHVPAEAPTGGEILGAVRAALGPSVELVVDLAMACESATDAIALMSSWREVGLAWVEDPLRGEHAEELRRIRDGAPVPLGAGDEVASESAMVRLVETEAVDVVRLDATCHGGITGFLALAKRASAKGLRVSAHTYPEIHRHCALAVDALDHVEAFAHRSRYDCAGGFVRRPARPLSSAEGAAGDEPGLGFDFDWTAIEQSAVRETCSVGVQG
jgi:L-alanine-DL-glutamate epimerase-like enolase superfamily enzyme